MKKERIIIFFLCIFLLYGCQSFADKNIIGIYEHKEKKKGDIIEICDSFYIHRYINKYSVTVSDTSIWSIINTNTKEIILNFNNFNCVITDCQWEDGPLNVAQFWIEPDFFTSNVKGLMIYTGGENQEIYTKIK